MYERVRNTIRVASLERSIDWYTGKLGFTLVGRYGERFAELDAPGMTLLLHEKFDAQPDKVPSGLISLGLHVADIETARRELESRGVYFEGETVDLDGLKIAFTSDPDGVPVYLAESSFIKKRS
jgi:catechol 2,3-dioxygenase-like lactoylglutathione lyase family enzyme